MNTQQEENQSQQEKGNVNNADEHNDAGRSDESQDINDPQVIPNEDSDPSQTGTLPSDTDTEDQGAEDQGLPQNDQRQNEGDTALEDSTQQDAGTEEGDLEEDDEVPD